MSRRDSHKMCKAGKRGDTRGEADGHSTRRVYTLVVRNHDDPEQNGVVRIPKRRVLCWTVGLGRRALSGEALRGLEKWLRGQACLLVLKKMQV